MHPKVHERGAQNATPAWADPSGDRRNEYNVAPPDSRASPAWSMVPLEPAVRRPTRFEKKTRGDMSSGTVKKLVADRGFGFITADDGKDYFFHRGALEGGLDFDRLIGGEKVDFEVEASPKGPRAVKVREA